MRRLSEDRPCITCGLSSPEVSFRPRQSGRRRSDCNSCQAAYMDKYRYQSRMKVLEHYSGGSIRCSCTNCDITEEEFLTIDHIDGGGNEHRRIINNHGGIGFNNWLIKNGYPKGYRILCMNCNHSLGLRGYCPYEKH